MRKPLATVLAEALQLDDDARAEKAWSVEIVRRVAAIEAGTMTLEPWEDVRRRIEKELLGQ